MTEATECKNCEQPLHILSELGNQGYARYCTNKPCAWVHRYVCKECGGLLLAPLGPKDDWSCGDCASTKP